jgi:hypothetical protein
LIENERSKWELRIRLRVKLRFDICFGGTNWRGFSLNFCKTRRKVEKRSEKVEGQKEKGGCAGGVYLVYNGEGLCNFWLIVLTF